MILFVLLAGALLVTLIVSPVRSLRVLLQLGSFFLVAAAGVTMYVAGPQPLLVALTVVCGLTWLLLSVVRRPQPARPV